MKDASADGFNNTGLVKKKNRIVIHLLCVKRTDHC